jgi:hypothetical protein
VLRHRILAVAAAAAAAVLPATPSHATSHHVVQGQCQFAGVLTGTNSVQLVVTGIAVAPDHPGAVATTIRCEATVAGTTYVTQATMPGAAAVTTGTWAVPVAPVSVCFVASAAWLDGHTASASNC